jgi:hypothetical protein
MQIDRRQNALFLGFITIPCHLLLIYLAAELSLFPPAPAKEPVVVSYSRLHRQNPRELDLPPETAETPAPGRPNAWHPS